MVSSYQRSSGANSRGTNHATTVSTSTTMTPTTPSTSRNSSNGQSGSGTPQGSNRLCAQCRNHGLRVPVRGHKRYCTYRLCTCRDCRLVRERQRVVALHLYVRRAQEQEEEAAAAAEAARERDAVNSRSQLTPEGPSSGIRDCPSSDGTSSSLLHNARSTEIASADTRERMLYESLLALRSSFPVSEAGLPLLLCILKSSRSVHEASSKIIQGTHELSARGILGLDALARPYL